MSDASPHSAAGSFVAEPAYEREVVQMPPKMRRVVRAVGLAIGIVIPALLLLYDPYGFEVTCREESRECDIVEKYLFHDKGTTVAFDDIKLVQTHTEWSTSEHRREPTGRFSMTFNMVDGRSIDASLTAPPEDLKAAALRAYIKAPSAPALTATTTHTWSDVLLFLGIFLAGLLIIAVTLWRTEVSLDHSTKLLRVSRRLWPLVRRTVLAARVDQVKSVRTEAAGDYGFAVIVSLHEGSEVRIARTLLSGSADTLADAIRRKV